MTIDRNLYNTDYHRGIFSKYLSKTTYQKDKEQNITRLVKPSVGDNILEVGCSAGATVFLFAEKGATAWGVDFDIEAINIAEEFRSKSFAHPERCSFYAKGAGEVIEAISPNKVIMIDFTEHVSDAILSQILSDLKKNHTRDWTLYIYTPNRLHWIEWLKKRNLILRQDDSHTDLRNAGEYISLIRECGYTVTCLKYRPFYLQFFKYIEQVIAMLPLVGNLFKRRILITATPVKQT